MYFLFDAKVFQNIQTDVIQQEEYDFRPHFLDKCQDNIMFYLSVIFLGKLLSHHYFSTTFAVISVAECDACILAFL